MLWERKNKQTKTKSTQSKHLAGIVPLPYEPFCLPVLSSPGRPNRVLLAFLSCVPCHEHIAAVCMESSLLLWPCH